MMKRGQYITKLHSELIKEKKLIDLKLDEVIAKQCYLEKTKYELLPKVVIPTTASNVKFTKVDKSPNATLYTTHVTPPNTPSKPIIHYILSKRPLSDTEKANMKRIWKDVICFNFHDDIDDSKLLKAKLNSTWTLFWTNSMLHNICHMHSCNHITVVQCSILLGMKIWKHCKVLVKFMHF